MPDSVVQVANKELDPSALSTQQVWREIAALKELFLTRLEEQDKAVLLLQSIANRSPTINEVYLQHEEKFRSIQIQFQERDTRTEQNSVSSKVAVDAALQAAKEAVAEQNRSNSVAISKSESATAKQIEQLALQLQTASASLDSKITDVKERMTRIEGMGAGRKDFVGWIVAAISIVGGIIAIAFALLRR